jgi:ABC-type Na+ efflux pump permease subunit
VTVGDSVQLDASNSNDDQGIVDYAWHVKLNDTWLELHGQQTSFTAQGFGMYEITLVARDSSGNAGTDERSVLSLVAGMDMPSQATWTSTPLGQDVPFNVMTFVYGAALLSCVIFIGGLFSKGFKHEIQKGTAKTLFFAPVSVTNMVFAKMLYPLAMGPIFIFPLVLISTLPLQQDLGEVFMITLVSYLMTALILASAAYGSCLLYVITKRMTLQPTTLARTFMYLSVLATLTVFMGLSFLMDQWLATDMWSGIYGELGSGVAMFSPFHQGGILISNMLLGTTQSLDWFVFAIPAVLIVAGAVVSTKLYPDLFSRE